MGCFMDSRLYIVKAIFFLSNQKKMFAKHTYVVFANNRKKIPIQISMIKRLVLTLRITDSKNLLRKPIKVFTQHKSLSMECFFSVSFQLKLSETDKVTCKQKSE